MVGETVEIEEILFQGCPRGVDSLLLVVLDVPVALVEAAFVQLPISHADPTEFVLAGFFFARHVVATSILFDRRQTLGTVLGVGRDPIGSLRIVFALLDPFLQHVTVHRFVPLTNATETKMISTVADNQPGVRMGHLDGLGAARSRTPFDESVAFHKTVGDQQLILELDLLILYEPEDILIGDQRTTSDGRAGDGLTGPLVHDLGLQVFEPTVVAVEVSAFEPCHVTRFAFFKTNFAQN
jgi:hypothetical protein